MAEGRGFGRTAKYLALISQIGIIMVANILVGFGMGYFLDRSFGTGVIFLLIGNFVGVASGFYQLYKMLLATKSKGE